MKICVVILNWNRKNDTEECIKSVLGCKHSTFSLEVVVVDNGSTDGSETRLKNIDSRGVPFEIIPNGENLGYAGGNNVGIRHALNHEADFVLILNNDTIVDDNFLEELVRSSKRHPKIGIFTPKIYFAKGFEFHRDKYKPDQLGKVIWSAGGRIDWKNVYGQNIGVDEIDRGQFNKEEKVDFATGAAMFVKASVFKEIGLFDENYFMYMEDVDFSIKATLSGWGIIYVPKAILWHKVARSSAIGGDLNDYYIHRNRMLFALKHAPLRSKIAVMRESVRLLLNGRNWQRKGVRDFYLCRFGEGSWE